MEGATITILLFSACTIALVHTLAPDHWIPFVSLGRARGWSTAKVLGITAIAGVAHIGSSVAIGAVGMAFGFSLTGLEGIESGRGEIAGLLLIGFGLAYAVWGLKNMRAHRHKTIDPSKSTAIWGLIIIFILGPCEPLIPLMFVAATHSWGVVVIVTAVFALITIVMMLAQTWIVYIGIDILGVTKKLNHHHGHILAGLVIAVTGLSVMMLGI